MKCNVNVPHGRKKTPFDTGELTMIQAYMKRFNRLKTAAAQTPAVLKERLEAQRLRSLASASWTANIGDIMQISPERGRRVYDFLVSKFGQKARGLIDPGSYGTAGEVRFALEKMQQEAEGMVNLAGRIESIHVLTAFTEKVREVSRQYGLNAEETRRLQLDLLEIGRIPDTVSSDIVYTVNTLGNMASQTPVMQLLSRRYDNFVQRLKDIGIQPDEYNGLINASAEVAGVFNSIRAQAEALGVSIPNIENLGYFARSMQATFVDRLRDIRVEELLETVPHNSYDMSTVHARARATVHYTPWDAEFAAKLLGLLPYELESLLDSPTDFRRYLHENLTAEQLDTLVDAGVFAKLPMSTTEVYDYFVEQYQFPMQSVSQMVETDLTIAVQKYTSSLQQAAGASALVRGLLEPSAMEAGFTVTREMVDANPSTFANFVSMGDSLVKWAGGSGLTDSQALMNMGLASNSQEAIDLLKTLGDSYVHPVVAQQWASIMSISTNPALLSQTSAFMNSVRTVFNKLTISSSGLTYIVNNALSSSIMTVAGGGNLLRLLPNFLDTLKAMKYGLESFDNVRPYVRIEGKEYTRQELMKKFLTSRGQALTPGVSKLDFSASSTDFMRMIFEAPAAMGTTLQDIWTYTMAHGDAVGGKTIPLHERFLRFSRATSKAAFRGLDPYFGTLAFVSNAFEIAAKMSVLETILYKTTPIRDWASVAAQLGLSGQVFKAETWDEAMKHIDAYFPNPYTYGEVTQALGSTILPFAGWRMSNPPMQLRHAIRKPFWYLNYMRLNALSQDKFNQEENVADAAIEPWLLEAYPWFIGRDQEGRPMLMIPGNFDPILDGFKFFRDIGKTAAGFLGYHGADSDADRRKRLRGESVQDLVNGLVAQTYPHIKGVFEAAANMDTLTGRKYGDNEADQKISFLGLPWNSRAYLLVRNIPGLSKLDSVNPGNVFGTPAQIDRRTGEVLVPPTPSFAGTTRTRADTKQSTYASAPLWTKIIMLAGLTVRTVDYDKNVQSTYGDISSTITLLEDSINRNRQAIIIDREKGLITPQEAEARKKAIQDQIVAWGQLKIDQIRLLEYMDRTGVTPQQVLRDLDKKRLKVRQLPLPGDELLRPLAAEFIKKNEELLNDRTD